MPAVIGWCSPTTALPHACLPVRWWIRFAAGTTIKYFRGCRPTGKPRWLKQPTGLFLRAAFRIHNHLPPKQKKDIPFGMSFCLGGKVVVDSNHRSHRRQIYSLEQPRRMSNDFRGVPLLFPCSFIVFSLLSGKESNASFIFLITFFFVFRGFFDQIIVPLFVDLISSSNYQADQQTLIPCQFNESVCIPSRVVFILRRTKIFMPEYCIANCK